MKQSTIIFLVIFSLITILFTSCIDAQSLNLGRKLRCKNTTLNQRSNNSNISSQDKFHATNKRSLLDSGNTDAIMTLNSFEKGGDGGAPSECDGQYHSNNFLIVALSTGWYNHGQRCLNYINIYYKDITVRAQVVDECDSNRGCRDNIVDASYAVWLALQVSQSEWGETGITCAKPRDLFSIFPLFHRTHSIKGRFIPSHDQMSTFKASNKRKEIVFDDEMVNVDVNEELDDVINKISKIVFDEKIDVDKNEELDDLVNKMSKEGAMEISCSSTKFDRLRHNKKPRVVYVTSNVSNRLPLASARAHSRIKRFVERYSRVGKYSIKDVLVDQDDDKDIPMPTLLDDEAVLKTYENFKKFDTVIDHSDHLFSTSTSPVKQPAKDWVEKIQQEWRILAENLPETIFVRVYESRMDLLRAVIIGKQGTPYHNGLFVFDVYFPSTYPISPPVMRYHSYGLGINPMMYECGEVRLKRFLKVNGLKEEMWVHGTSTMLDLLVCIQDRVLNKNPLLNEPGYSFARGSLVEKFICLYNENTLIKCLKTMVYTMNKPAKNFEGLVVGHFRKRVRDILTSCKDYMEDNKESDSIEFKNDVLSCIKPLIAAFDRIGAKEAQEFIF